MFALRSSFQGVRAHFHSARNASTLILGEHKNGELEPSLLNTVTAATKIGGPVSILFAGKDISAVVEKASKIAGVETIYSVSHDDLEHSLAENLTAIVEKIQADKSFSHILVSATNMGKNVLPRVSAKLDMGAISDVLSVIDESTYTRPMYAGNAIAKVQSDDKVKLMSVRSTAFEKSDETSGSAKVEKSDQYFTEANKLIKFIKEEVAKSDRPEITAADVVIAGGRGLKNGENFEILYQLADKLGGAVGASRAAVDAGYVPNDMQIGQTGKVCAPNLYVAVGISGAIQHLAGMKDSKCIVAINKDEDAPIFQVADYGLVADLFEAVPEITKKI